jgi:hypothetical protein
MAAPVTVQPERAGRKFCENAKAGEMRIADRC